MGHGISLGVVVGFVGEEKDGWRAEDKAVAQVPAEQLLEGLGAVLALPEDGFVEGCHYAPPKNTTLTGFAFVLAPALLLERISQ